MSIVPTHIPDFSALLLAFLLAHLLTFFFFLPFGAKKPFFRAIMERAGGELSRRLNRAGRPRQDIFLRGAVACLILLVSAGVIGAAVERIAVHPYGWTVVFAFLALNISVMGPLRMMHAAAKAVSVKDVKAAGSAVRPFVQDDLGNVDAHTVARRALEASAIALNDLFIAPGLFFLIGGAAGLGVYAALTSLADVCAEEDPAQAVFGKAPRAIGATLNFVPACIAGILISAATLFVSRSNPLRGLSVAFTQSRKLRPLHKALPIAAFAGGIGVALGGPYRHNAEKTVSRAWIGPENASAKITEADIRRGAMLYYIVFLGILVWVAILAAV